MPNRSETDQQIYEILSSLPNEGGRLLLEWAAGPITKINEFETPHLWQASRYLRHPSRARRLRAVKETTDASLGRILQMVFPVDHICRCNECGVYKLRSAEFFGHTPSGRFRRQCKKCMARFTADYDRKHPASVRRRAQKRRSLERAAGPRPSDEQLQAIRISQNWDCHYCPVNVGAGGEFDHKVPLSRGGTNDISNFVLSCQTCNRDKADKTKDEFLAWRRARGLLCRGDKE